MTDEKRQTILRVLTESEREVLTIEEITDYIVSTRLDHDVEPDKQRRRLRAELHHIHLPKLQQCGLIIYDTETRDVELTDKRHGQELLRVLNSYDM